MAFPWKILGRYALQFAEYALEQRMRPVAPSEPTVLPQPSAPVVAPPVLTLEQRYRDQFDAICMEEWGRLMGDKTPGDVTDRYQNYKLLEAGREDEVRRNLCGRK